MNIDTTCILSSAKLHRDLKKLIFMKFNFKRLPPHSADPLPEFQFRDCGFVVSGTGFQNFRLRSVGISIFLALELPDTTAIVPLLRGPLGARLLEICTVKLTQSFSPAFGSASR